MTDSKDAIDNTNDDGKETTGPDTALNDDDIKEFYDNDKTFKNKCIKFANLLKNSKHCVVYTGAGISTSAQIPDYRGPNGIWTQLSKGMKPQNKNLNLEQALPTYAHMSLVTLINKNIIKYVVSTNVDGLHRRSGLSRKHVAELHGNVYREICMECEAEYLRPFNVIKRASKRKTGRLCQKNNCNGKLRDSIVNFGDMLPTNELSAATKHSKKADLVLVLGTIYVHI